MYQQGGSVNCNEVIELSPLYLSGELDLARATAFTAHLGSCPDCARAFALDSRLRREVLAQPADTARIDHEIRREIGRQSRWRRASIAGGIAAMLALALFIYRKTAAPDAAYAAAAQDHRREVVDHERRTWMSQPEQVDALAARQGISMPPIAGYRLEHAKLCRLNGRIFLHAVYSDGAREYSLFLHQPDAHPTSVRIAETGGECVAGFETPRVTAMVVTEQPPQAAEFARLAAAAL